MSRRRLHAAFLTLLAAGTVLALALRWSGETPPGKRLYRVSLYHGSLFLRQWTSQGPIHQWGDTHYYTDAHTGETVYLTLGTDAHLVVERLPEENTP